jgi:hypothetical protein
MLKMRFADDLPLKSQIFDYWKDRLQGLGFFIDWGEPGCWACGFHYRVKYDIKRRDAGWPEIFRCWDRIPLQRCHIIPRSLGGTNDVGNLFLMCRECHDLAPNTNIPEIFFDWVRSQNSYAREASKIRAALESYNISIDTVAQEDFCALINSDEFNAWVRGKCGLHRPQSNYAPVSARLTAATMVGLAIYYWRASGRAPCLESIE